MTFGLKPWLIIDVFLYIFLLGLGLSLGSLSLVSPIMAPISCSDPGLQRPFKKDTFPIHLVIILCTFLPAITIFLLELVLAATGTPNTRRQTTLGCGHHLRTTIRRTVPLVWDLLVGELFAFCIMELLKITTGMPRPHFWHTCGFETKKRLCGGGNESVTIYLQECDNPNKVKWRHLADAAKSFPSGHSCLAVFCAVYMTAYIFYRLRPRASKETDGGCRSVALKWLPFVWLVMACIISTSRLWDERHHWWDLIGGGLLGAIMAALTVTIISGRFRTVSRRSALDTEVELTALNGRATPEPSSP